MNLSSVENSALNYSAKNEPILSYAPGSPERAILHTTIRQLASQTLDMPMFINGK